MAKTHWIGSKQMSVAAATHHTHTPTENARKTTALEDTKTLE